MKTLLSILILIGGGVILYLLYNYALNSTPQIKIDSTKHINKSESLIIQSYLNKAIEKEQNKKRDKNISITSVLNENNITRTNPKELFNKINLKSDDTYTINGSIEP